MEELLLLDQPALLAWVGQTRLDRPAVVDVDEPTEVNVVHELDVEMQTSYDVAPELAPHVSVGFLFTFVAPFDGELFENAPGSCEAGSVENVRHVPPSAAVVPAVFVACTCQ